MNTGFTCSAYTGIAMHIIHINCSLLTFEFCGLSYTVMLFCITWFMCLFWGTGNAYSSHCMCWKTRIEDDSMQKWK